MARSLAEGASREDAYRGACEWKRGDWQVSDPEDSPHEHRRRFARLFSEDFKALREDQIRSGGYVLETLEAVVWCLLRGRDYKDCVLNAVNLGQDTDTIAALTGGLAGIHGKKTLPIRVTQAPGIQENPDVPIRRRSAEGHGFHGLPMRSTSLLRIAFGSELPFWSVKSVSSKEGLGHGSGCREGAVDGSL
jgi:hypothetical protein